ncbi:MAG: terminase small subunit [Oscillospiraceae bacterium]|nr:terminase small subunit [Oscillospiraceae bacterium]
MKTKNPSGPDLSRPDPSGRNPSGQKPLCLAEAVLAELRRIAFANLHDYVEYKAVKRRGAEDGAAPGASREYTVKDSRKTDGAPVSEVAIARDGTLKFKLYDKMKALELLGKSAGLFAPAAEEPEPEEELTPEEAREFLLKAAEELRQSGAES